MANLSGFFSRAYTGLAPYLLPIVLAFSLYFYFTKPEPEIIKEVETRYLSVEQPVRLDTVTFTVRDTIEVPRWHTRIDTHIVYLPGEEIQVTVASADTTMLLAANIKDTDVEAKASIDIGAKYFFHPINTMTLTAKLNYIVLNQLPPSLKIKLRFGVGIYVRDTWVGFSGSAIYNHHGIIIGYHGTGFLAGYQYFF